MSDAGLNAHSAVYDMCVHLPCVCVCMCLSLQIMLLYKKHDRFVRTGNDLLYKVH
jgi:uncharacterized membrane protein